MQRAQLRLNLPSVYSIEKKCIYYYIPMRRDDYAKAIEDQGFKLVYNPLGDGNCQFAALSHQAKRLGILRSPETMRKEIVEYLKSNPYDSDGFPLLEHLADDEFACWDDYITHMARDGTYGDQITLYAAANLYNIDIQIVSSLGVGGQHVFSPSASVSAATVYLGHLAENQGEHYVSLEQVADHNDASEKEYDENDPGEGEIPEDYANEMHIEQDVVDFEMGDSDAKTGLDIDNDIANDGDKLMEVQFVSDVDIDLFAARGDDECHIGKLPDEVLEKILEIALASSAILFAGNACHTYQTLRKVNTRFRASVQRLKRFLPRLHVSGGLKSCLISARSLLKKYGPLSGLLIELKKIISSPKWANAWLEVQVDELDWYVIIGIFWKRN
ncbi:unnamed protein product [Pocillopora meandrina]|uniref:OTU domain-containing protein n=1 Tax=Pocillopora meandrina TaxID=46732 RepID=A0AAU9Y1P1_9CNID|nr:unnamed protein product [Pocillopora meandrina]